MQSTHLIGSVLERKPSSTPSASSPRFGTSGKTGFPAVQHRNKSIFARAREERSRDVSNGSLQIPVVQPTSKPVSRSSKNVAPSSAVVPNDWRDQAEEENARRVEAMTEEEREQERREIFERFGSGVGDVLRRAREAREAQQLQLMGRQERSDSNVTLKREQATNGTSRSSSPPSALSRPGSRPSSRADRKLRFADVTPNDIYVYESAPPSPRKQPLALPPPTDADGPVVYLGDWKGKTNPTVRLRDQTSPVPHSSADKQNQQSNDLDYLEEGTPEDIRRRFFPTAPANDPSLAWIGSAAPPPDSSTTLRFDLTGTPIPTALTSTLPTHLGLHHHADGAHAGYTLDDVFLLSRSTVPAQRAAMLGILGRIARRLGQNCHGNIDTGIEELVGQEAALRKRILAAGVEAMSERGSLGARAVEVMWECIVGWDEEIIGIEGVELQDTGRSAPMSSSQGTSITDADPFSGLPLDYVLPQISTIFSAQMLPCESLTQLLAIVHRFAQHTNEIASTIITTSGLISSIVQTFLLTPIPPTDSSPQADPAALQLLITLALSSRANASALLGPADALLRFVTTIPSASPFPPTLATALLVGTLRLYTVFASYGLYAHIATTAAEPLAAVGRYILSEECRNTLLRETWFNLLEAWMVCARDPHRTVPSHEILWSQVVGWGWVEEILEIREKLSEKDEVLLASVWRAGAAYLEGAMVNGIRGGGNDRSTVLDSVKDSFSCGVERKVVENAELELRRALGILSAGGTLGLRVGDLTCLRDIAMHANTLAAVLRLWLSCLSPQLQGPSEAFPFLLPFSLISEVCAKITVHPIWSLVFAEGCPSYMYQFCRPLSLLLSSYLQLTRRLPGISEGSWMAQAFAILCRLLPGDEEFAQLIAGDVASLITSRFMDSQGWNVSSIIWENGGMDKIKPFLTFSLGPKKEEYIGPSWISPLSIAVATTQRLPSASKVRPGTRQGIALPLTRDWLFSPLDHLLRSGESEAFRTLPSTWNASETEVVRAVLCLAKVNAEILRIQGLNDFIMTKEETIFACMKIFMLEHGQQQNDSAEEVFRDSMVSQFMEDLLAPFGAATSLSSLAVSPSPNTHESLEAVAARFLGPSTPFYQFYTDFVGLYDAISFSHPLFARLLLPPSSMRYPLDYRRYLWADYGHVLKTIRTPIESVITDSIGEYLWPVEADAQIIGAYVRALVKGSLTGFVRLVAIHHVACNIWPDLYGAGTEEKASKLLKAVTDQGAFDVVREVVLYRQVRAGTTLIPPACFAQAGEWKASRLRIISSWGGDSLKERLRNLLE
ncbi:hypothetical protein AcW1_007210 [Taiwanofungus camphoratus]|nr:hypothetical protein AcW2_007720 [Antrodia cinnamomea]KAI0927590.1 hypothetical protein AcV5_008085 [Antrodia cinnamomea]KAI0952835.1 hypothetical protein AcW1_007210 [Antrodia cinnamomea]